MGLNSPAGKALVSIPRSPSSPTAFRSPAHHFRRPTASSASFSAHRDGSWSRPLLPLGASGTFLLLFALSFLLLSYHPPPVQRTKDVRTWWDDYPNGKSPTNRSRTDVAERDSRGDVTTNEAADDAGVSGPRCEVCEKVASLPCVRQLPQIRWLDSTMASAGGNQLEGRQPFDSESAGRAAASAAGGRQWRWKEGRPKEGDTKRASGESSSPCAGTVADRDAALALLEGHWVVLAGDSQVRESFIALLRLLLSPPSSAPLISSLRSTRHAHLTILFPPHRLRIDFRWAPLIPNITTLLNAFPIALPSDRTPPVDPCWVSAESFAKGAPDLRICPPHLYELSGSDESLPWWPSLAVPNTPGLRSHYFPAPVPSLFLLGAGLWHMLWLTDAALFHSEVAELRAAALRLVHLEMHVPRQHRRLLLSNGGERSEHRKCQKVGWRSGMKPVSTRGGGKRLQEAESDAREVEEDTAAEEGEAEEAPAGWGVDTGDGGTGGVMAEKAAAVAAAEEPRDDEGMEAAEGKGGREGDSATGGTQRSGGEEEKEGEEEEAVRWGGLAAGQVAPGGQQGPAGVTGGAVRSASQEGRRHDGPPGREPPWGERDVAGRRGSSEGEREKENGYAGSVADARASLATREAEQQATAAGSDGAASASRGAAAHKEGRQADGQSRQPPSSLADKSFSLPACPLAIRPAFFWLGLPVLIHERLKDQRKKERMTGGQLAAYKEVVAGGGLLLQRRSKWRGRAWGTGGPGNGGQAEDLDGAEGPPFPGGMGVAVRVAAHKGEKEPLQQQTQGARTWIDAGSGSSSASGGGGERGGTQVGAAAREEGASEDGWEGETVEGEEREEEKREGVHRWRDGASKMDQHRSSEEGGRGEQEGGEGEETQQQRWHEKLEGGNRRRRRRLQQKQERRGPRVLHAEMAPSAAALRASSSRRETRGKGAPSGGGRDGRPARTVALPQQAMSDREAGTAAARSLPLPKKRPQQHMPMRQILAAGQEGEGEEEEDKEEAAHQQGRLVGPFWLVELGPLTAGCGQTCSHDGLHYNNVTYDAAVQLMMHGVRQLRACG